ncbi:hypothetical protein GCM10017600_88700 [Streptosporangium carneum]|uniref:Uncharacterized protein n=1 Tax=Streptosporangium carneum TaxID=47481 RepID=A0A9W6IBQ1_9ACTN|nr:hypothetical protein GCM10017600_88700 [Streptosporangium carneum]
MVHGLGFPRFTAAPVPASFRLAGLPARDIGSETSGAGCPRRRADPPHLVSEATGGRPPAGTPGAGRPLSTRIAR